MDFTSHWRSTSPTEKERLATKCSTSVGFLNNIAGGFRRPSPELAASIERATRGAVMRWDLRPDDWRAIWPEIAGREDAPKAQEGA